MTIPMIITIIITVIMIYLIMTEKLPFGAPPLLACLLFVVFGIVDIKTAFGGFANPTILMLASFMAIIAALQKTRFISAFKRSIDKVASRGGLQAYVLLVLVVMLGTSLFGTGSTAYYVLTLGLLSTIPYNKNLPASKIIMSSGFAANHPLIPVNVALQFGIVTAVLEAAGASVGDISVFRFSIMCFILSMGFFVWTLIAYKILPSHSITSETEETVDAKEQAPEMPRWKENVTYVGFTIAVIGMLLQSQIGDAGYAITGLVVALLLAVKAMDFTEIRNAISSPIILMSAGVIGVADAMGSTGLTNWVGERVASMLNNNISPFILVFVFCILTSVLATLTGSTLGTVYIFAPMAIATCMSMGLNPTAAAAAIVVSGWNGHFLPIDGMPAMIMGIGKYKLTQFWKFTIPMYFIRLLALTLGALLMFPM